MCGVDGRGRRESEVGRGGIEGLKRKEEVGAEGRKDSEGGEGGEGSVIGEGGGGGYLILLLFLVLVARYQRRAALGLPRQNKKYPWPAEL